MVDEIIGSYKLLEKIGEGGMGEVFRGIDLMLEREVAIKFLRPEFARQPDIVERFRKEAIVLARLNHPNIATLYSFVRHEDRFFMVMEFAHGQTLEQLVAAHQEGIPWQWALSLFCQALRAIEHAHGHGIVHRDIKPANMMLSDRNVLKVLDFGIARVLGSSHMTRTGLAVGTLKYMSPEQVRGREVDTRSDIYSLGIVLYKMLTGRTPFEELAEYDLMKAQVEQPPLPLGEFVSDLPKPIEDAVTQALAKAPEERIQTAADFLDRLEYLVPKTPFTFEGRIIEPSPNPSGERRVSSPQYAAVPSESLSEPVQPERVEDNSEESSATQYESLETVVQIPHAKGRAPPKIQRAVESPVLRAIPAPAAQRASMQRTEVAAGDYKAQAAQRIEVGREPPEPEDIEGGEPSGPAQAPALKSDRKGVSLPGRRRFGVLSLFRSAWARHPRFLVFLLVSAIALSIGGMLDKAGVFKPRPLSQEEKAQIHLLLEKTEKALADSRLVAPDEDNAEEHLVRIFKISPRHPEAMRLIEQLSNRLVELGHAALRQGEIAKARIYLNESQRLSEEYAMDDGKTVKLAEAISAEERRLAEAERQKKIREEQERQIAALMDKARAAAAAGRFIQPKEASVLAYAQQVLQIHPTHAGARQLIADSAAIMVNRAREALKKGEISQAKSYQDEAIALSEKYRLANAETLTLADEIAAEEKRLADLARQKAEEARLAERRRVEQALALEAKIKGLVKKVDNALHANRLDAPAQDNAVEYAAEILKLDPHHKEAQRILADVVDKFIASAQSALSEGDLEKAERQQQAAEQLVARYNMQNTELRPLGERIAQAAKEQADEARRRKEAAERRIAEQEAAKRSARAKQIDALIEKAQQALAANRLTIPSGESASDYAGQVLKLESKHPKAWSILEDIVGRLVASGEVALANDQLGAARERQRAAERVIKRYGLSSTEFYRFSARLEAAQSAFAKPPPKTDPPDTTAQMKELEERRKELERREQALQEAEVERQKEATPPTPPPQSKKRQTFIPPAF